jgi:hypothetical protein
MSYSLGYAHLLTLVQARVQGPRVCIDQQFGKTKLSSDFAALKLSPGIASRDHQACTCHRGGSTGPPCPVRLRILLPSYFASVVC